NSYHYSYLDAASAASWGAPLLAGSLTPPPRGASQDPGSTSAAGGWTIALTTPASSTALAFLYQVVEFSGDGAGTLTFDDYTVNVTDTCPDVAAGPDPSLADTGPEAVPALLGAVSILFAGAAVLMVERMVMARRRRTT